MGIKSHIPRGVHSTSREAGSALLVVIGLSLALAMGTMYLVSRVTSSAQLQARLGVKRQLSPKTEAAAAVLLRLMQSYFKARQPLEDLPAYLQGQAPSVLPSGTALERLDVEVYPQKSFGFLRTGPYKGLYAAETNIRFLLTLSDEDRPQFTESVEVLASYNGIGFFQFTAFYFGKAWAWNGPSVGRVHANGDTCLGWPTAWGYTPAFTSLTSAGRILDPEGPDCYNGSWTAAGFPLKLFARMDDGSNKELKRTAVHGCTNCDGSGLSWKEYAETQFQGKVKDVDHEVMPLEVIALETQNDASLRTQSTWGYDNTPTGKALWDPEPRRKERILIEPAQPSDTQAIKDVKYAYNADIRIINGVWYLRDPRRGHEYDWPGIPVWSDHPGRFRTNDTYEFGALAGATVDVGQDDIRDRWAGTGYDWGAEPPKLYSYYRYMAGALQPASKAVISYGTLRRYSAGSWRAGFLISNLPTGSGASRYSDNLCGASETCTNCNKAGDTLLAADASDSRKVQCSGGTSPALGTQVLFGTRGGYRNTNFLELDLAVAPPSAPNYSDPTRDKRSKVLPMNFDFEMFQQAMKCTTSSGGHPAEIGCYFGSMKYMGRPFNGVIFITSSWENWRDNPCDYWLYPGGKCPGTANGRLAPLPPFQGSIADSQQGPISHLGQQEALPYALCGAQAADLAGGVAGSRFDRADVEAKFKIPDCKHYVSTLAGANFKPVHPGEIRIHNANQIDGTVLPRGISIVSPIVTTTLGNVNTSSDFTSSRSTPWHPMLIASDYVFHLSNDWEDHNAPWDVSTNDTARYGSLPSMRKGADLNVNMAVLGSTVGWVNEDFRGKEYNSHNSVVFISNPVYVFTPMLFPESDVIGYQWDRKNLQWDAHFNFAENMPPGTPLMNVFTLKSWKWRARK